MRKSILSSLPFLLLGTMIFGQLHDPGPTRPKIGYVLSGGGAKGMAHVGVLKVLEEVGLQPDFITGTSMGSIMGGLYSIGYSAEEISRLIETIDWDRVLTNEIPSNQVIMRQKHEYSRFVLELPVWDGNLELPSGLIEGQKLSALFSELSWRQAGVDDFMDFPVSFICIGTDLLDGEKVLLNSGDLSSAMRASMAIPSVFSAVIRDSSHVLVDGGVVRNFPVQEAIDMGADIIIGVYVGFESEMTPEQLRSLTSVITRTSLLSGAHDVESQIPLVDYLIVPELKGFSPSSFSDGVAIMNRGEEAARKMMDQLRELADSVNALGQPEQKPVLPDNDSIWITDIRVLTDSPTMARFVTEKTAIETGNWLRPETLNTAIDRLFGTLFFEKVEYYFEPMNEGYRLVFRIKEKPPASVKAALHYNNTFGPGLILNYTRLNTLVNGSRLGVTGHISEAPQFRGYFDFHMGRNRGFIGSVFLDAEREKLPFFENDVDIGNYSHQVAAGGMGIRQTLSTNRHVGLEFYYHHALLKLSRNIKEVRPALEWLDKIVFRGPELRLLYEANTFDHNLYPTRGYRFDLHYRQSFNTLETYRFDFPDSLEVAEEDREVVNEQDPYWHLEASFESFLPLGERVSLNTQLALGLSKDDKPFVDNYYLGGYRYNQRMNQIPFVGLRSHELLVGNYLSEKIALQWEAVPGLYISGLVNIIFHSDILEDFPGYILDLNSERRLIGVGAGFTYRTPLGPVSAFYGSRTDVWNPIWYLNIGFPF